MDEQELLHRIRMDTDVNIGLLKDLYHNEEFRALIKSGKTMDAILHIRAGHMRIGLREAKMAVEAFAEAWK
jgi:hypothetical protein